MCGKAEYSIFFDLFFCNPERSEGSLWLPVTLGGHEALTYGYEPTPHHFVQFMFLAVPFFFD